MLPYLLQLQSDLESAILARWQQHPPHYYEMGVPGPWLTPPAGYDGPPPGFGRGEESEEGASSLFTDGDDWLLDEDSQDDGPPPESPWGLEYCNCKDF